MDIAKIPLKLPLESVEQFQKIKPNTLFFFTQVIYSSMKSPIPYSYAPVQVNSHDWMGYKSNGVLIAIPISTEDRYALFVDKKSPLNFFKKEHIWVYNQGSWQKLEQDLPDEFLPPPSKDPSGTLHTSIRYPLTQEVPSDLMFF